MASLLKREVSGSAAPAAHEVAPTAASRRARVLAYVVDSVVLFAFILVFFVLGGLELIIADQRTPGDPPDAAYYAFFAVILGGTLLTWSALNIGLQLWRGQTAGMYVIGIRIASENAAPISLGQIVLRWLGLQPLLFHPLLIPVWGILALLALSELPTRAVLVITVALVLLCVVAPAVALATVAGDPARRALHDRLAGTVVVTMDRP